MNANTGKIEINRDWYEWAISVVQADPTAEYGSAKSITTRRIVAELKEVIANVESGKAVLV